MGHFLFVKSSLEKKGGLEKYSWRILQALLQKKIPVTILTTYPLPAFSHPLLTFHPIKPFSWPGFFRLDHFDSLVESFQKKNPHSTIFSMDRIRHQTHLRAGNGTHRGFLHHRKLLEGKKAYFLSLINPWHQKILEIEKTAFTHQKLQKIITNSHMVKEEILNYYQIDSKKITTIHNGVEWEAFEKFFSFWQEKKASLCQKWELDTQAFQFLFIGNGYARKGLAFLLEALSHFKGKEDFQLSVIGKEKKRSYFQHLASSLGLEKNVKFFGPQQEILDFYQIADSLVIPSFYDPFANVTVEALAMGLFVVSSPYNGGSEVLSASSGIVIKDLLNKEAFIEALKAAFKHKKTKTSSLDIRNQVAHLDFSYQLPLILKELLGSTIEQKKPLYSNQI